MQNAITPVLNASLTPRSGLESFFRQRKLFFWTASVVVVLTLLATVVKHRQYSSEMKFLVQNNRGNVVITPEKTSSPNGVADVTETQVNSELEILHSHDVLDPVADPDWAALPEKDRTPAAVRQHEKLINAFERRLSTDIVRKTNVIIVRMVADTPKGAQQDLERVAASYIGEHRKLQRPSGASDFFKSEAERTRAEWDQASQKLVEFQQAHQLVSLPERESFVNEEVADHERDLLATDASLRELDAQMAEITKRLQELPMRQATVERTLPNQQSVEHLTTLLVDLENRRTALLTNFKASDRTVQELDHQIATTKAALAGVSQTTAHEQSTDVDPAWQQLHTSYIQAQINRRQAAVHRASVVSELASLRQGLSGTQGLTVQFNNLEARANQAKQNYELYAQKRDQAQIEDAMDEQKLINVAVAQKPTLSYIPVSPKPLSTLALGLVTSLFLGLCVVYLAESGRTTFATPRELDSISRYPVLATMPCIAQWDRPVLAGVRDKTRRLPVEVATIDTRTAPTLVRGARA
jgi:protein tyrosine kinase modulator